MGKNKGRSRLLGGLLCVSLGLGVLPCGLHGQQAADSSRLNATFFKNLGSDFKNVILSPGHWETKGFLTFAAVLGTGGVLYALDRDLYSGVQDLKTPATIDASKIISKFGNGAYLTGLMAALYLSGEAFDCRGLRNTALLSMESFLTTSAVVLTMKMAFGRARPNSGSPPSTFHPFSFSTRNTSLPSGDAAAAFAVATTIADRTDAVFVDLVAYGLASLVAFFRVHDEKHWPSDVFIGSALGYCIGKKISALNRGRRGGRVQVSFGLSPAAQGVTLVYSF